MEQPNEQPNHVLSTYENILVPKNEKMSKLRNVLLIVIASIIVLSMVFQDNLFSELSWTTQVLFIPVVIWVFTAGGSKNAPSPIELRFHNDYLVLYRPKRYYDKKVTRMEINKFMYKDIDRILYKSKSQRIHIYGTASVEWFNYSKDGVLPSQATTDKTTSGLCFFRTSAAPEVNFVSEIENHSPIKVIVEDR
ncbi:hypothetical protein LCM10_08030 [Rossellomorea aquimaris]|uniref:hypothetical protein n=1 Tax=Rossellomorea aquimaris TaxID=189382 RepID=UPI001CD1E928|nr:hypothetical protein [Rossellomorea aquimaris]MCA1054930.1 hypothetical protein [Rossellomorea aquimaris]